jgi:hypothetical protein
MPNDDEVRKIANAIKKLIGDDSRESSLDGKQTIVYDQKVKLFLTEEPPIEPGDLVTWKNGLKNKKYPPENTPVCVIDVLSSPAIKDDRDSGSPYFREPLDLILAVADDDGDLMLYHYDRRRFQVHQKGVYPEAKKAREAKAKDLVAGSE